jgi:hypothetical protein
VAADEPIRIEIGFDGGQIMGALVEESVANDLERAIGDGRNGAFALEADDGRYTISLQRVVYVKRFTREGRVGFSGP